MHSFQDLKPLWLFSLGLLLLIIVIPCTQHGMFLDGVIYAAIAKNESLGYGSLWHPAYSKTLFPVFYEHPPLAIYFQSLFFKWFGQGFGVERFYCFLMAAGQFSLIGWYWLTRSKETLSTLGMLLLLWLLIPLNQMYIDNMLEGTLSLFTTFASLLLLAKKPSKPVAWIQLVICSTAIVIAFFCNGPVAFFPLAIPVIRNFINKDASVYQGLKETAMLIILIVLMLSAIFFLLPDALINTQNYFKQQLLASIVGSRQLKYTGLNHLNVLLIYIRAYWVVSAFALGCLISAAKIKGDRILKTLTSCLQNHYFLIFFLLSLVSSLPVGISHRQAFSYIIPSASFYTLAMMWLCHDAFNTVVNYCKSNPRLFKGLLIMGYCFFSTCLIALFCFANGIKQNKAMLKDIDYLVHYLKNDEIISASPLIYNSYYTAAYFSRNAMISITPTIGQTWYITLKNETIPKHYHAVDLPLYYYNLAHRNVK